MWTELQEEEWSNRIPLTVRAVTQGYRIQELEVRTARKAYAVLAHQHQDLFQWLWHMSYSTPSFYHNLPGEPWRRLQVIHPRGSRSRNSKARGQNVFGRFGMHVQVSKGAEAALSRHAFFLWARI